MADSAFALKVTNWPKQPLVTAMNAQSEAELERLASPRMYSIATRYSSVADDGKSSTKGREAAMLMSVAEGHLDDEEEPAYEAALTAATEAMGLFKAAGSTTGSADAMRLIVQAKKAKSVMLKEKGEVQAGNDAAAEAVSMAKSEMEARKAGKDEYGAAVVQLALAEAMFSKKDAAQQDALMYASGAQSAFKSLGDTKMEASAWYSIARINMAMKDPEQALAAANEAVSLYKLLKDMAGEAKALGKIGEAHILSEQVAFKKDGIKKGVQSIKAALGIFKMLKLDMMTAYALYDAAYWMNSCMYKPTSVVDYAGEALDIFRKLKKPKAMGACLELLVLANIKYDKAAVAQKAAEEEIEVFKEMKDEKRHVQGINLLSQAWLAQKEFSMAKRFAQMCAYTAKEHGYMEENVEGMKTLSKALLAEKEFEEAMSTLDMARDAAKEMKDQGKEASVLSCIIDVAIASDDVEKAVEVAEEQRELYGSLGAKSSESDAMLTSATCLASGTTDGQKMNRALSKAREAQELAQRAKNPKAEANALMLQVTVNKYLDDDDGAAEAAEDMMKTLKNVGQSESAQSKACCELAKVYAANGNFKEALDKAEEAVKFGKKVADDAKCLIQAFIAAADVNFTVATGQKLDERKGAQVFHKCAKKAQNYASLAKASSTRLKLQALQAQATAMSAEVGMVFDGKKALEEADEAAQLYSDLDDVVGNASSVILKATILFHGQKISDALGVANQGLGLAQDVGSAHLTNQAEELIERIQDSMSTPGAGGGAQMAVAAAAAAATAVVGDASSAAGDVVAEKAGLDPAVVQESVMKIASSSIAADDELELDTPLMEAGMDSLSSVAFRNALMNEVRVQVPAALMFDYPNIRLITDLIVEESKR
mmetsp:Transcript_159565/g.291074  ORF Transcript_159565/g.291074 Transcript_159565/m.291074 type:complete len:882 (-) Transcript_159565:57-2702(-)